MTFKYRYRKQIIIGIIVFIISGGVIGLFMYKYRENTKHNEKDVVVNENNLEKKSVTTNKYQVDIKGEINYPGIYKLDSNSRVIDVIKMAGDLTENADTSVINLSKKISDEMVIIIYSKEEVEDFKKTKELENQVENFCIQKESDAVKNDACIINDSESNSSKISINTASIDELKNLTGIGEKKAKDIINYREKNGLFKSIEDIMKVNGIGEAAFAQIKEDITV